MDAIVSWQDIERYRRPTIADVDIFPFETISARLPDGMGLMTSHAAGVFVRVSGIRSLEPCASW